MPLAVLETRGSGTSSAHRLDPSPSRAPYPDGQVGRKARRTSLGCRLRPISTLRSTSSSHGRRPSCLSGADEARPPAPPVPGKFVPQLAEVFCAATRAPGRFVWDPFAGSGTTLVEANAFGARAAGRDVSAFNCLLTRGTRPTSRRRSRTSRMLASRAAASRPCPAPTYLDRWFAPGAVGELLAFGRGSAQPRIPSSERRPVAGGQVGGARAATTTSTSRASRSQATTSAISTAGTSQPVAEAAKAPLRPRCAQRVQDYAASRREATPSSSTATRVCSSSRSTSC